MYRKILVLVDNRKVTQSAINQAIELAQVQRAEIFFFCLLPHYEYPIADMLPVTEVPTEAFKVHASEEASRLLAAASYWAERCGVHSHRAMGSGKNDARCAVIRHCDLIVVGTEEQNAVVRLLSGNIVPGLISASSVPVLVCRERAMSPKRNSHLRKPFSSIKIPYHEVGTRSGKDSND